MPADTAGQARTGEGEYRRLPVADGSDIGYHDSGHGEAIVLAHAGVFSDWFRLLSLQLPRARYAWCGSGPATGTPRPVPGTWPWPITPGTRPACWTRSAFISSIPAASTPVTT